MIIASWNVRGREGEVSKFLRTNKVSLIGLVETRIKQANAGRIRKYFGSSWSFVDNYLDAVNGHIWVMWDASLI